PASSASGRPHSASDLSALGAGQPAPLASQAPALVSGGAQRRPLPRQSLSLLADHCADCPPPASTTRMAASFAWPMATSCWLAARGDVVLFPSLPASLGRKPRLRTDPSARPLNAGSRCVRRAGWRRPLA